MAALPEVGIIPARAGSTSPRATRAADGPDHPRSRGVYARATGLEAAFPGSSPLARGLLQDSPDIGGVLRIIPARAGSTPAWSQSRRPSGDHPRSRGVYWPDENLTPDGGGSSPLARGLPKITAGSRVLDGIIPARAGSTLLSSHSSTGARDHPRSRGVYNYQDLLRRLYAGSSPLARGLRAPQTARGAPSGIIPARAGSTEWNASESLEGKDHPRSRGVYPELLPLHVQVGGSSPLARGLPQVDLKLFLGGRIIPARAGSTVCAP